MYLCFPIFCICPAHLAVCWTQKDPLSWRPIQSSLSSQLGAVPFLKLLEGVGRLGPTKVKVEERFFTPARGTPIVWVNCGDREPCKDPSPDSCSRGAQPEALCAVLGVGMARFLAGAYV